MKGLAYKFLYWFFNKKKLFWLLFVHHLSNLYIKLRIQQLFFWILFLIHRYSPKQFSPSYVKENITQLSRMHKNDWLKADAKGRLTLLLTSKEKWLFSAKNILLFGALLSRAKKVVYYTFLTLTIEIYNPFDKQVLEFFLERKLVLLEKLLKKCPKINEKVWDIELVKHHMALFQKSSLMQQKMIKWMHEAVKRQKPSPVILDAQEALKKGLYPLLITTGLSGSYWMRNTSKSIAGLFKPFDEEIHAPNNPIGPSMQGALGQRRMRRGIRVGEAAHREVGAYLVDQFFQFGIVPHTYYATFAHHAFYSAKENRFSTRVIKTKYGSFQEFLEGFLPAYKASEEERDKLPLEEFQLLVILDVIVGNLDRHMGNILIGEDKIAAIDHGLIFPDCPEDLSCNYWEYFNQGKKPLFPSFVELLDNFPFEKLSWKLKKNCSIQIKSLERMRERVTLFAEGVNAGLVPAELTKLMKYEYLRQLLYLDKTLKQKAQEVITLFLQEHPKQNHKF